MAPIRDDDDAGTHLEAISTSSGSWLKTETRAVIGRETSVPVTSLASTTAAMVVGRLGQPLTVVECDSESRAVVALAGERQPSTRDEYEITDLNRARLEAGKLKVAVLPRGTAWFDTDSYTSLMQAAQFVQVIEERQGLKIGCPEEVACREGYISRETAETASTPMTSGYGQYVMQVISGWRCRRSGG
jgi:hypothetical protein